ncbi:MAG TPA: Rid family hydrolase [Opitutales bacterium]|nr:Rid family hydrolase [Opitutales bacterium]
MKRSFLSLAFCILCATTSSAAAADCASPGIERREANADIGYCEVVRAGDFVYISGNVGWGAMPDAVKRAYDSLGRLLGENGLSFADVVKENVYTTDMEALKAARSIRNAYYGETFPAATWVQVDRLFNEGLVLEVELVAYAPRNK